MIADGKENKAADDVSLLNDWRRLYRGTNTASKMMPMVGRPLMHLTGSE